MFAVQAQPNLTIEITPQFTYWVTFGMIQQGEFFSVTSAVTPVQVACPLNVNSMTVTLSADNTVDGQVQHSGLDLTFASALPALTSRSGAPRGARRP